MSKFIDEIKKYLTEHDSVKVVSFDIFNTVLLRYANKPEDVFEEAGKLLNLPFGITAEDYKYIRIQTQKEIQDKKKLMVGTAEVNLEEIVSGLPVWLNREEAIQAEVQAEKELDFGNPEIVNLITWLEKKEYRIIYVSDMYLSAEQIEIILTTAKVPKHMIFVSNEFVSDKKSGQLFQAVLHSENLKESQIIHIGDNFEADVLGAEKCGLKAFHYRAPYSDATAGLAMEEFVLGDGWTNKNILRHIAGALEKSDSEEMNKWHALGAQMIGPLLVYFMEWLFGQITRQRDEMLLFFMREGSFFQKAWQIYSRYYGIDIDNKLVFVSRRALLLPAMEQFGESELKEVMESSLISLAEIFQILGIAERKDIFLPYLNVQRKDFDKIKVNGVSLYQAASEYILSERWKPVIEDNIKREREKVQKYFQSLHLRKRVATVDIGYQGTIQKRLERIISDNGKIYWNHYLLLCNGEKRLQELERSNIRGALGTYCSDGSDLMSVVNRNNRSLELLFLEGCGSTIGYTQEKGETVPVLGKLNWPEKQKQQIENCQRGALDYLRFYLECPKKKEWSSKELLQMLHRLLSSPSYTEAELLGNLVFDENNGTEYSRKICEDKDVAEIKEVGVIKWQQRTDYEEVQWVEGLFALGDQSYILQQGRYCKGYNESYALILVNKLIRQKKNDVYIVAAGTVGRLVARYARMANIHIKAFVDNNPALQGKSVENIPVISLEKCERDGRFVIASIPYKEELEAQVLSEKGHNVDIIM